MDHDIKLENFETFAFLKNICKTLIQDPNNLKCLEELADLIDKSPNSFIKVVQPTILSTFYPIIRNISENKGCYTENGKLLIIRTLTSLFQKSIIDKLGLFFNIYALLLFEVYDHVKHKVLDIPEEYKLSIMECTTALSKSVSSELLFELYTRKNAPKLCQMLYVAIEIARNEKLRTLKNAAITCIMAMARVLEDEDFEDVEIRNQVAEVFLFFLPGVASGLKKIALEDEKVGHKVPKMAIKAWGRIITLLMQDYNNSVRNLNFSNKKDHLNNYEKNIQAKAKWKNNAEINEYLQNTKRSPQWYDDTDKKLQNLVIDFTKLSHHSHISVRSELTDMCELVIKNCLTTMPRTVSHLIEIVIILIEDEDDSIALKNTNTLKFLSAKLSSDDFKNLLEAFEERFYVVVNSLPRKFNSVDERDQLIALNSLIGYLQLFGEYKLSHVLLSGDYLQTLMKTLIHISELKNSDVGLLQEYAIKDFNTTIGLREQWKIFYHFNDNRIKEKVEKLCMLLGQKGSFRIISDFLLDVILYQPNHRKEAIFILNQAISGCEQTQENLQIIENIKKNYLDSYLWYAPIEVCIDEYGDEITLAEVQHNIIQVCLLVEGIGTISSFLNNEKFLLDTLYLILEKTGSNHTLVRSAGLLTLQEISKHCGYNDITSLINENIDYFTFLVERKLNRTDNIREVLSVLAVVIKYSKVDILQHISDIIAEVLVHSCDRFKDTYAIEFLQMFKIFINRVREWFNIATVINPIKSRTEKQNEIENFQISGIEDDQDFSDDIMGKSAEELYKEDMAKKQEDLEKEIDEPEVEAYKKPEPPLQVKLTVAIISRSLQFLPSKNQSRKILTLEILCNGLEIIKDWEDELLPIVHQIWSPLVERFKEFDKPLIINLSFHLLVTLARLSKDFIRMRTTKEVLPHILDVLNKLAQESYLKDKGSAYRYSQNFKLQLTLLENLGRILIDLDIQNDRIDHVLKVVYIYLSDKQPLPLQNAAMELLRSLKLYDSEYIESVSLKWSKEIDGTEFEKNVKQLCKSLNEIKI